MSDKTATVVVTADITQYQAAMQQMLGVYDSALTRINKKHKNEQSNLYANALIIMHLSQLMARAFKKESEAKYASAVLETASTALSIGQTYMRAVAASVSGHVFQASMLFGIATEMGILRAQQMQITDQMLQQTMRNDQANNNVTMRGGFF